MKQIETIFDNLFQMFSRILMSFIKHLAKFIVPIPPSWYWMQAVSESSGNQWVGIFAAVVLEIGGMLAAHFAIAFYGTAKGKLSALLTGVYLIIGVGVMWLLESATNDAKLIITAIFIIAGMVYVLSAMYEIENQERGQIEEDRSWERLQVEKDKELERQLKIADKKLAHEERLEKERLTAQIKIERAKSAIPTTQKTQPAKTPIPVAMPYECSCGRVFEKPQSYSAHTRHCETHKELSLNGHGK